MQRCSYLGDWAEALGWQVLGDGPLKARVQPLQGCVMAEELYPSRLTYSWREASPQPSLLLVQHGRCVVESGPPPLLLHADGANAALIPAAASHRLTVNQAPCRLVRLLLPVRSIHPGRGAWRVDLGLMLPMLRLLEQALRYPGGEERRGELGSTLLDYLLHQLAAVGCGITLAPAEADPVHDNPTDGALLPRLKRWLGEHLEESLQLGDLAAAMALSPRRLQELCRQQAGCTPMEVLRRLRLEALARRLRDPGHIRDSLGSLLAGLKLPNSAATRSTFVELYGCSLQEWRERRGASATDHTPAAL